VNPSDEINLFSFPLRELGKHERPFDFDQDMSPLVSLSSGEPVRSKLGTRHNIIRAVAGLRVGCSIHTQVPMEITSLRIQGFRSLRDVTWRPGKLNVIIGPNASGKTNLLRSLDLLKQSATGNLEQTVARRGGLSQMCWDGLGTKGIAWNLECSGLEIGMNKESQGQQLAYELSLIGTFFPSGSYRIEHELLGDFARVKSGEKEEPFKYLERDPRHAVFFDSSERRLTPAAERIKAEETLLSQVAGLFSDHRIFFFHQFLASLPIYHELRVGDDADVRKAAVTRREVRLSEDGQNLIPALHTLYTTDRHFKSQLNSAMRAAFGRDFDELEFPPAEDQRVQLRLHWGPLKNAHSSADLSEGTLRFLMLIAILANPQRGDLIAIDEPEGYLHPSMFPVIADLAFDAAETSQIVFTTHSPQFLDALGTKSPVTTITELVDGATQIKNLDPEELRRWLQKYTLGELFRSGELEAMP
jgi:predicted ATPase